jgi:predicted Co/Zn/Cd cation transporter (cation efflux family)
MPARDLRPALVVAVWTFLVWTTRIRNIWSDTELSQTEQVWRTALAVAFTIGAVAVAGAVFRAVDRVPAVMRVFAVFTTVAWVLRGGQIVLGDWGGGFKAVHSVLALGSIALVWWADRSVRRSSPNHLVETSV